MKQQLLKVISIKPIAKEVFELKLSGDTAELLAGQFVNLSVKDCYLRRPISICDAQNGVITLIFKVVGRGTEIMSELNCGDEMDALTGLGNGFDFSLPTVTPLLVGGGVGLPPLYLAAKRLLELGARPGLVAGFNTAEDAFYLSEFKALGMQVIVCTADGSLGKKGFVTDVLGDIDYDYVYSCGPLPMLRALCAKTTVLGQYSMEARMACGFGACMGCSIMTAGGAKRVCKDGPVFKKEELIWN